MTNRDIVHLECTHTQFHKLTSDVDKTKKGSETVRTDIEAMRRLLLDHGKLIRKLNELGIETKEKD